MEEVSTDNLPTRNRLDYNNGKIYIIRNSANSSFYIGGTTQKLSERMAQHRKATRNPRKNKYKLYSFMNDNGIDNFYIELVEYYPCSTKEELFKREGEIIREYKPDLNKRIEGRKASEYHQDNKEKHKEYKQEYNKLNKDRIKQQRKDFRGANKVRLSNDNKQYREKNKEKLKEKGKAYRQANKSKIKEYKENNKDRIKEKDTEWRTANNEHLKEYNKTYNAQKYYCPICDCEMTRGSKNNHNKSKRHQKNLKQLEPEQEPVNDQP